MVTGMIEFQNARACLTDAAGLSLSMKRPRVRQVLDCASPLALWIAPAAPKSARGLAQSKTLTRQRSLRAPRQT